ncbi:MAG: D-alanyl-D-alanine carboxypeptidase [Clostridia bacterium]|nr:D-alanyl-D-alanine carboxypeptidase [Clostridia bacterium]
MLKKIAVICIVCALLMPVLSLFSFAGSVEAANIGVSAKAYCLLDADLYEVIGERNSSVRLGMASTTKIMTALIAIESGKLDHTVEVDKRAVGTEGSSVYLADGERMTLRDLVYALMLASANDAAEAIAYYLCGSIDDFTRLMNEKAREMGLENTHFTNPHGLSDGEHYTTAKELAVLSAKALENEAFREIVSKRSYSFLSDKTRRSIANHNRLLASYKGCIGVKTGFTKKDGRCLVSAAERDGKRLVAVTLSAPDDWNDHKRLLDFGFSLYEKRELCKAGEYSFYIHTPNGAVKRILAENAKGITLSVRKDARIKAYTELDRIYYREINKGDTVGYTVFKADGKEIARVPLLALQSSCNVKVKKSLLERIWESVTVFFKRISEGLRLL